MSFFSRKKESENPVEITIVFEMDKEFNIHTFNDDKPVEVKIDGEQVATLLPGESKEVKIMSGKHKLGIDFKGFKTGSSPKFQQDCRLLIHGKEYVQMEMFEGGHSYEFFSTERMQKLRENS